MAIAVVAIGTAVTAAVLLERRRRRWVTVLTNRIPEHHVHWRGRGKAQAGSLLYVALGDSAALGIGASSPAAGYVGILADAIASAPAARCGCATSRSTARPSGS